MSIDVLQISPKTSNDTNESVKVNRDFNNWAEINLSKEQRDSFNKNIAVTLDRLNYRLKDSSSRADILAQVTRINNDYKRLIEDFNTKQASLKDKLLGKLGFLDKPGAKEIANYLPDGEKPQKVDVSVNTQAPSASTPTNIAGTLQNTATGSVGTRVQKGEEKALGPTK